MNGRRFPRRFGLWVLLATPLAALPTPAVTGKVVGENGEPLQKVKVCYLVGASEQLCVETDATGKYDILNSAQDTLRISLKGYIARRLPAVDHHVPIVLRKAAVLRVWLESSSGDPIPEGRLDVIYPSGRKLGPLPVRQGGLRVTSLEPGTVRLIARAAGHDLGRPVEVQLIGGEVSEVTVELQTADADHEARLPD